MFFVYAAVPADTHPLSNVNKADSSVCTKVVRQGFKAANSLPQASVGQLQGAAQNKHIYEDITVTIN